MSFVDCPLKFLQIKKLTDSAEFLKNTLSAYESKRAGKENALDSMNFNDCNETKVLHLTEENLQVRTLY